MLLSPAVTEETKCYLCNPLIRQVSRHLLCDRLRGLTTAPSREVWSGGLQQQRRLVLWARGPSREPSLPELRRLPKGNVWGRISHT